MRRKISTRRIMFSASAFIIASSLMLKSIYTYARNQAWQSVILAMAAGTLVVSLYSRLAAAFPGLTLSEISGKVFGRFAGKIVCAFYAFFFLFLLAFNTYDLVNFVKSLLLPNTPLAVLDIAFIFVCASAVRGGAKSLTACGALVVLVAIAALAFNGLLLIKDMRPENFLPAFTVGLKNILISTHFIAMVPFCEIMAFMEMAGDMEKPEQMGTALKNGLVIGGLTLMFIVLRDIAVLGNYLCLTILPTFLSIRLIDVGDILTRMEIIYAIILLTLMFNKASVLYYASVKSLGNLLGIPAGKVMTNIVGALAVVYVGFIFTSSFEYMKWFEVAATFATFFLLVLPALTLCANWLKTRMQSLGPSGGQA